MKTLFGWLMLALVVGKAFGQKPPIKKDKIPSTIVNVEFMLMRFATVSGKRIFLTPNLMNLSTRET